MGEAEDRVKRLVKIIKGQDVHAINDIRQVLDDEWRTSRQITGLLGKGCLPQSARRYLLDLKNLGLAEHRQDSCGIAQWRRRQYNGED